MSKYYKIDHFRSKDNKLDIYFQWYTTKSGNLKFDIEIFAACNNDSRFCTRIAKYNTAENSLLQYIKRHNNYIQMEV